MPFGMKLFGAAVGVGTTFAMHKVADRDTDMIVYYLSLAAMGRPYVEYQIAPIFTAQHWNEMLFDVHATLSARMQ